MEAVAFGTDGYAERMPAFLRRFGVFNLDFNAARVAA